MGKEQLNIATVKVNWGLINGYFKIE